MYAVGQIRLNRLAGGNMADYVSIRRLSGIVSMQAYLYARVYRNDRLRLKSLVWLLPPRRSFYSILTINHRFYLFGMAKTRGSMLYTTLTVSLRLLDILHTVMVSISNWLYLIDSFGNQGVHDTIFW